MHMNDDVIDKVEERVENLQSTSNDGLLGNRYIYMLDSDAAICESIKKLAQSNKLLIKTYARMDDFLDDFSCENANCILLDLRTPGVDSTIIQNRLNQAGASVPIIFMTSGKDVDIVTQAMQPGKKEILIKPFDEQQLLAVINKAVKDNEERMQEQRQYIAFQSKLAQLSSREREVLDLMIEGMLNKNIANMLQISNKTVEAHRARLMSKLNVKTFAELVKNVTVCKYLQGMQ